MSGFHIFDKRDLNRPECRYILFIALSQIGMFFYSNDMYWVGEPLRVIGAIGFVCTLFLNCNLSTRQYPISFQLLTIMILLQTLRIAYINPPHTLISTSLKESFAGLFLSEYIIPSLMPIILFSFKRSAPHLDYLIRISVILAISYFLIYPFAFVHMIHFQWSPDVVSWSDDSEGSYSDFIMHSTYAISNLIPPYILLFWKEFMPKRNWLLTFATWIGGLLIAIYLGRRGWVFALFLFFTSAWLFYIHHSRTRKRLKVFIFSIFLLAALLSFFIYNSHFMETLLARGFTDTRREVEISFLADMKPLDWLIGRGWFGCYYDPMFEKYRMGIETGYLTLILRGGVLYLLLYLWVLVESAYKGLIKSNNKVAKSFALYIIIQILLLYPGGQPSFSLNYITLWLGVFVCLTKRLREMNDVEIRQICFRQTIKLLE